MARDSGSLVLAIVTTPFEFEGSLRRFNAEQGLKELRSAADAVIVLPNQRLRSLLDDRTTAKDTFTHANELLAQCASGIWRLLTRPGLLALDFANLEKFVRGRHVESAFAMVETSGESRALNAVDQLSRSPFLDHGRALTEADGILVSLAGGPDLTINDIDRVSKELTKHCREHTHWVVGTSVDESLSGKLQLTIIATRQNSSNHPSEIKESSRNSPPMVDSVATTNRAEAIAGLGGELSKDSNEPRSNSGHTAPPPELSPQLRQAVMGRQPRGRRRKRGDEQPELGLFVVSRSRFADTQETVHNKQNLDEPTYLRRGMALN
jgi:cell division protein FtsZ